MIFSKKQLGKEMEKDNRTKTFFQKYAYDFDAIYGNKHSSISKIINNIFRKSMRLRFEKTIEGCVPIQGKSVLDIGCGPGHYAFELARRGAKKVVGIDFAPEMIKIAKRKAKEFNLEDKCSFIVADFMTTDFPEPFDYSIVMGVMDYIPEPEKFVKKVIDVTSNKAFFSFPVKGGLLALQRKIRYRSRCELYFYSIDDIEKLLSNISNINFSIERIARDFFVSVKIIR